MKTTQKLGVVLGMAALAPVISHAGITVYEDGDKYVEIGGRLQAQYKYEDFDPAVGPDADATDDFFLRRMRFYIEGSVTENWSGIWQVDFG
ncbi:MAG: hypothetical protein SVU69_10860, partial [Pseudomonadota bacterium]|nr:hypothetical protein [Pseudomonadota bacterium]